MLGSVAFVVWAYVMIAGTSNGVNLADGLDGLATGASVMVFASYVLIGIWQFGNNCALAGATSQCYDVRDPLDLAVVAAAVMGACFGFLWWNASPAKIFMGDTGSLALGGALAGLAILSRTELLLVLLGGLFVLIALSVIVQVGFFKLTAGGCSGWRRCSTTSSWSGWARDHHRHPVLDHRRPAGRAGAGPLLRRVGRGRVTGPSVEQLAGLRRVRRRSGGDRPVDGRGARRPRRAASWPSTAATATGSARGPPTCGPSEWRSGSGTPTRCPPAPTSS